MEPSKGTLYLFPTPISDEADINRSIPGYNLEILKNVTWFVAENIRTARRFISKCGLGIDIGSLYFTELSEHSGDDEVGKMLEPLLKGNDCILMSEAGVPAVADPGSNLVAAAHRNGIKVVPLAGPSSIIMSLMASGMNGQSFAFVGYLPVKSDARAKRIKELGKLALSMNQPQIFIETPYRNVQLAEALTANLPDSMKLTVAVNITSPKEHINTKKISEWRKNGFEEMSLHKNTAIFIIG